ncbi:MAG: NAD-dependent epimerase [Pseudomonadota bacterium]
MKYLVTGTAGFIGYHTAKLLVSRGDEVVGFDVVNDYYDVDLKYARLRELDLVSSGHNVRHQFIKADLADSDAVEACFSDHKFDRVIHLAAQAGVRYSIENPSAYVHSNITGFTNILEACREAKVPHLTYASTSSIYGLNTTMPYSEHNSANHPLQFYAATKRSNELMAHAYSNLFDLPTTGLRFFTVYGPWGRPDMAPILFLRNILEGQPIKVFNHGKHRRDFTYIDDIAKGVVLAADDIAAPNPDFDTANPDPQSSSVPWRLFNIGNSDPINLMDFIAAIENAVDRKAIMEMLPLQPGDVPDTYSDSSELEKATGFRPSTSITDGVHKLVEWYRSYHQV